MSPAVQSVTDVFAAANAARFVLLPVICAAGMFVVGFCLRDLFTDDVDPDDQIDWDLLAQTPRRIDDARRAGAR